MFKKILYIIIFSIQLIWAQNYHAKIRVENIPNMIGMSAYIEYNPAIIKITDTDPSLPGTQIEITSLNFLPNPTLIAGIKKDELGNEIPGTLIIGYVSLPLFPKSGSGECFQITFNQIAPGMSGFYFQDRSCVQDINGNIDTEWLIAINGTPGTAKVIMESDDYSLSITMAAFNVEAEPGANIITWKTVSELNNAGFNLFRSVDTDTQLQFQKINYNFISGAGSTPGTHFYEYKDTNLLPVNFYWYKLEGIDYDGKTEIYGIIKFYREPWTPQKFNVFQNYPNPFNNKTTIEFNLTQPDYITFSITDNIGKTIYILSHQYPIGKNKINFDGDGLSSGTYYYTIKSKTGNLSQSKRMVLIK